MYLLDNNVLGTLGKERRESSFFRERCRVPAEVAHEARRVAYAKTLDALTIAMAPDVLTQLVEVMKTVPVGSTQLIDLYGNKGAADPILVAMALALNNPAVPSLFSDTWVIVTNDKDVHAKALEFSVGTLLPKELADVIAEASYPA
ncbi:MAG: hypothetical protein Q7V58_07675 [Actinomycetota bacterium]|nr:hypothetical protein [Actinomycetota bacterium]